MGAVGKPPVGFPKKKTTSLYRLPPEQVAHWNGYCRAHMRADAMTSF